MASSAMKIRFAIIVPARRMTESDVALLLFISCIKLEWTRKVKKIHAASSDWLPERFILGVEQSVCLRLILRAQTGLLAGGGVFAIENRSAAEQYKTMFHDNAFQVMNRKSVQQQRVNALWASFSEVVSNSGELCLTHRFTDTFTDSGRPDLPNSLLCKQ